MTFGLCAALPALAEDAAPAAPAMSPLPAATPAKGEFDNSWRDGSRRRADHEDGLLGEFSPGLLPVEAASKEAFLKNPQGNIQKAREFFASKQASKAAGNKEFTEDDVNAAVKKVVDEKTKDGAFVFHDPKLDQDLNLVMEQVKGVRGMEGYGWFANVIFHDKDEAKKQYAIDFWFKPEGDKLNLMDIRVQKGPEAGR